jgi:HAD domain in Swiss Army Knife RNA repair proteins
MKILYLDFDGVLHPSDVWMVNNQPVLQFKDDPSLTLFCWAPILESILDDIDPVGQIRVVLSTTWAHRFGYERASEHLPESLKSRVIGVTEGFPAPRITQIITHTEDNQISRWIAIDDDFGEALQHQEKLIKCSGSLGISSIKTQQELRIKLEVLLKRRYQ